MSTLSWIGWVEKMFGNIARRFLIWCRFIPRVDLVGRVQATHPETTALTADALVVVRDGSIEKWACFQCPGGCGQKIQLSLSRSRRPRWSVRLDWLGRPTVEPSIRQTNQCHCHFWVRQGQVQWCADSPKIKSHPNRSREMEAAIKAR
ncbi:DUF6527 family protein [Pseudophaeobacter sp. 1A09344]|uniref:DUF6527 family protein n=2 Tax=Pseudophaeobacter sp. 1A09344 TaxID=3098144 RepID=UPI0034D420D0